MGRDQLWTLVDPRLTDDRVVGVMEQILEMATSEWQAEVEVDLRAPLVRRYISDHRLWTLVPPGAVRSGVRGELRHRHRAITATLLQLRSTATAVLERFSAEGIESRVLKGLATGELDYPSVGLRHTGDVDLAVLPEHLDEAVRLLCSDGYQQADDRFSPYLRYGSMLRGPNGVEIDVHTRLSRRSPLSDRLFQDAGDPLALLPGRALCVEQRLVHASGHFLIAPPGTRRLSGLLDVTLIHGRHTVDLEAARRFAADLGIESLVGAGLWVEAMLARRCDVLAELELWQPPDWLERKTRLVSERRLLLDHLGRYREVPSGQRLRYLPAWLLPTPTQRRLITQSARQVGARVLRRRQ